MLRHQASLSRIRTQSCFEREYHSALSTSVDSTISVFSIASNVSRFPLGYVMA